MKIYAIKDDLTRFGSLICLPNDEAAKRLIRASMRDKSSDLYNFAENMALYSLGEYNDESGVIVPDFVRICSLVDFKED